MKNRYFLLAYGLLALCLRAAAQDFRPFRTGLTYHFSEGSTPGDTTHALRLLKPGSRVGNDSVFRFNTRAATTASPYCPWQVRPDNLFGATLTVQANAAALVLTAANGRSLVLRPRAAVGTSWAATPGLTATLQSRGIGPVLGAVTDSVVVIMLSSGQSLRLSKKYGLLEGPALVAYLNGRNPPRSLTLTALPEYGLGRRLQGAQAIYDYQPGDVFLRLKEYVSSFGLCSRTWVRDSVLTRTTNPSGDSITSRIWHRELSRGYGPVGVGGYQCTASGVSITAPVIQTKLVSSRQPVEENLLSGEFMAQIPAGTLFNGTWSHGTRLPANRYEQSFRGVGICTIISPDSILLDRYTGPGPLSYDRRRYANGLGLTLEDTYLSFHGRDTNTLLGYRKTIPGAAGQPTTTEQWGQLTPFSQVLPTRQGSPAATTTSFPNPFNAELELAFTQEQPQALLIELRDALGRVVSTLPLATYHAGRNTVKLLTGSLPAGLYTVSLAGEGRREVLKVAKAQ